MTDTLHRFLFKNAPVKGELVQLPQTWLAIREHRRYPKAIEDILGQMVAAAALLSANLKFDGSLIMQIHGDGPIQLLVAECRADLTVRATAKLRDDAQIHEQMNLKQLVNANGRGYFAITLDPNNRQEGQQPYQGIVPLIGESIAQALMHYMSNSEQLDTVIQLAADEHNVAGFLLQRLPSHGGGLNITFSQSWEEISHIGRTLGTEELLHNNADTLLYRLFWDYPLDTHTTESVQFACTCSADKVNRMITMLGEKEAAQMLDENNELHVSCDFCGKSYALNTEQVNALFVLDANIQTNKHLH